MFQVPVCCCGVFIDMFVLQIRPPPARLNIPRWGREGFGVKKVPSPIAPEKGNQKILMYS